MEGVFAGFPRLRDRCNQLSGTFSGGEQPVKYIGLVPTDYQNGARYESRPIFRLSQNLYLPAN